MSKSENIPASALVGPFLENNFLDSNGLSTLRYFEKRFFIWEEGVYREMDTEKLKLKFTSWAAKKIKRFKNTKYNAEEALYHIRSKVLIHSESDKKPMDQFIENNKNEGRFRAFKNGIVNINDVLEGRDVNIIEFTPNFFNLSKIPFDFDIHAFCPIWLGVLERILPNIEDRKLLQQWFGYHLIPSLSKTKMMFFEGLGANGKSVVLLILRLMLGEENVSSIPITGFDADKTFKLAVTDGKLANIIEEVGPINSRVEETLKQFVNGGAFTVERKFRDPFTMYPTAKLTFATNEMPTFNDRSKGLWRRMLYIKFSVSIPQEEQRPKYLEGTFWQDSDELSGILNWAIEGAIDLEKNGFVSSNRKQNEIEMICTNSDLLRPWVQDNFELGTIDDVTPTSDILLKLKMAIEAGELPRVSQRDLFKEIQAQFPKSYRPANAVNIDEGKRARVICGVKLRTNT